MTRLAAFIDRGEAEAEAARREVNARGRVSPFAFGSSLAERTSLPEAVFLDWIRDAGADVPEPDDEGMFGWLDWWDDLPGRSPVRVRIWQAMDQIRCFAVVERPNVPVGYAALRRHWPYHDWSAGRPHLNNEGGVLEGVFRNRERAEKASRISCHNPDGDISRWQPAAADLFDPETYWDMAMTGGTDVVEIELHGLKKSVPERIFVVVRGTWNPGVDYWDTDEERIPVAGFVERADAEVRADELEADLHRQRDAWTLLPEIEVQGEEAALERLTEAAVRSGLLPEGAHPWGWWRQGIPTPTETQRLALWEALSDRYAFEVVSTRLSD
jgi:hypothetical protein